MHTLIRSIPLLLLSSATLAQHPCPIKPAESPLRINKLVIESNTLPVADREQLVRAVQQKSYFEPEIGDRVNTALMNLGYFKATIHPSDVTITHQAGKTADVKVKFEPGPKYHLGKIQVENATIFSPAQLRKTFSLQPGDRLSMAKVSLGLDNIRKLYATRGYINTVINPVSRNDDRQHIIDLTLELDEGEPYTFGQLSLDGVEPHVGASKAIMASWKPIEGRTYNPLALQKWFDANRSAWHAGPKSWQAIIHSEEPKFRRVNITLTQPCR